MKFWSAAIGGAGGSARSSHRCKAARGKEDAEHKGEVGKNAEGKDVKEVVSDS